MRIGLPRLGCLSASLWLRSCRCQPYDANGNTLTKKDSTGTTYTWDFENRLTSVTLLGSRTVTFKYDPLGHRIYKSSSSGTSVYF
jgi:YD repeat-containing protein